MLVPSILMLLACGSEPQNPAGAPSPSPAEASGPFRWVELQPKDGALSAQLTQHCAAASQAGLSPFVELTAIWCAPCQALRKSIQDPLMVDAFTGAYVMAVDVDFFGKELQEAELVAYGVPAIFALGPDCRPTGAMITGGAWQEDTPESMAPPLKAFFRGEAG